MHRSESHSKSLDLGIRKVSTQNFSKIVTLPKTFTDNYLDKSMQVRVTMSADGTLILTPIHTDEEGGEK